MVLDIRHNNGGDNTNYGPLLDLLTENQTINSPGFLYVIAGRQTFSATINFASDVDAFTQAIFVGEGTGGSPLHYGDPQTVLLPNSGIAVSISSRTHLSPIANDQRLSILPDIPVELKAWQYFKDIDPALEAILESQ
jgi:hypothetical protein